MNDEDIEKILYMGVGRSGIDNENSKIAKALNELMQYRAIGTVEGYELAINESIDKHNLMVVYKDRLKEFEAIGTIEEFKALKENQFFNFDSPVVRVDKKSYDKAIDEFVDALINYQSQDEEYKSFSDVCYEVADRLKGVRNEKA